MCLCNDTLDNQVDDERAKYGPIPVSDKALVGVIKSFALMLESP